MTLTNTAHCTGCRACEQICPRHCITMEPDLDGFLYPVVDYGKCVKCGLCEKYCPISNQTAQKGQQPAVYAAWLKDPEILARSSSGGAFTALAQFVLDKGGMVFGCAFNKKMKAVQTEARDSAGLEKLRGSKYVQSDTGDTFSRVRQFLLQGIPVLYSGTPCQIAGLKSFLHGNHTNLLTVDLICHGVPSPALFQSYLDWLERKFHGRVTQLYFRDKSKYGWGYWAKAIISRHENTFVRSVKSCEDPYYFLFLKKSIQRNCCNECTYASQNREGDFTIGDFWGIERSHPKLDTKRGVSLLLANSPKAVAMLPELSDSLVMMAATFTQAAVENRQLTEPSPCSKKRDAFLSAARSGKFRKVAALWRRCYTKEILLTKMRIMVPGKVKKVVKKLLH